MRIVHVVATSQFAGTERYVADVSARQAERGHDVTVLGGPPGQMPGEVAPAAWRPAPGFGAACRQLLRTGRADVVHAHLTAAEAAALLGARWRGVAVVSTRHIAQRRGSSRLVRAASPLVDRALSDQIAISSYVAAAVGRPALPVLHNGVRRAPERAARTRRTVLVLQRLEQEKDTETALRAWHRSGLGAQGWTLVLAGVGSEQGRLAALAEELDAPGVHWAGFVPAPGALLDEAALLLAPAPAEPLGLSVLEAMARGLPVLAAAGGGHVETLGPDYPLTFRPGDVAGCADGLVRAARDEELLAAVSTELQQRQRRLFDLDAHVDALLARYERLLSNPRRDATRAGPAA